MFYTVQKSGAKLRFFYQMTNLFLKKSYIIPYIISLLVFLLPSQELIPFLVNIRGLWIIEY